MKRPAGVSTGPAAQRRAAAKISLCLAFAAAAFLASCAKPAPKPEAHYALGEPYQSGGIWWYPRESLSLNETGLANVYPDGHPLLTTNGEIFSQDVLAAAHPTLQLPAIAQLTDLETGRGVTVRINDRGTPTPTRLVQVTRRVATLLGLPANGVAQVQLVVLGPASEAAEQRLPNAPSLAIATAPRGTVQSENLPPPPGTREMAGRVAPQPAPTAVAEPAEAPPSLSEDVTQGPARPGRMWVRLDTFQSYQYAAMQRARLSMMSPAIVSVVEGGRRAFRVMIGPFTTVAEADAAVEQAIRGGAPDARIVIE